MSVFKLAKRLRSDQRGNVLAITAAGSFALAGGAGLGTDTVQWFLWKRQLQLAADAGALAGAHALAAGAQQVEEPATREVQRNANSKVTVNRIASPPASGDFAADPTAVEVVLSTQMRLPFSGMFLDAAPVIPARAVAARVRKSESCVISLAGDGVGVTLTGSADVQLGCGVSANSTGSQAIYLDGSSYLSSPTLSAVGSISAKPANLSAGTDQLPYGTAQVDPLGPAGRNLQVPTSPSSCTASGYTAEPNKPQVTLQPGRYCNGMTLKGDVVLSPGVYIVDKGSFYLSSQAKVTGNGVTIVLTGSSESDIATVKVDGGATANLKAPTAVQDPYFKDILFFQDPRANQTLSYFAGGSNFRMDGVAYFPSGNVTFTGGSSNMTECLMLVAHRVTFTGNNALKNNCSSQLKDEFALRVVRVVE